MGRWVGGTKKKGGLYVCPCPCSCPLVVTHLHGQEFLECVRVLAVRNRGVDSLLVLGHPHLVTVRVATILERHDLILREVSHGDAQAAVREVAEHAAALRADERVDVQVDVPVRQVRWCGLWWRQGVSCERWRVAWDGVGRGALATATAVVVAAATANVVALTAAASRCSRRSACSPPASAPP